MNINLDFFVFQDVLRQSFFDIILTNILDRMLDHLTISSYKDEIITSMTNEITASKKGTWSKKGNEYYEVTNELFFIVEEFISILKKSVFKEQKVQHADNLKKGLDYKERVMLFLPFKCNDLVIVSHHLPEIVEPETATLSNLESMVISKDTIDLTGSLPSARSLRALNVSQKKKFKINLNAIRILLELDNLDYNKTKNMGLPFPTQNFVERSTVHKTRLINLGLSTSSRTLLKLFKKNAEHILKEELIALEKQQTITKKEKVLFRENFYQTAKLQLRQSLGFDDLTFKIEDCKLEFLRDWRKTIRKRQQFLTFLQKAPLYNGFPIYFKNVFAFRFRMYQESYLFSKTTGFYKYLVCDFDLLKLTPLGFYNFLKAYYSGNKEALELFLKIVEKPTTKKSASKQLKSLANYFSLNQYNTYLCENVFYFTLLELEISNSIKAGFKTRFSIEIDQKASSSVFVSLLTENKTLAFVSRVFGGVLEYNLHIRKSSKIYLLNANKASTFPCFSENVISFLTDQKDPLKYASMCYFYSQGVQSRFKLFLDLGKELGFLFNQEEKKQLFNFSNAFENLIDLSFPGLSTHLKVLKTWYEKTLTLTPNRSTHINTLNGSVIKYSHNAYERVSRNRFDNDLGRSVGFSYNVKRQGISISKSKSSFLANVIHSLDSCFIQEITLNAFDANGYIINHLHDSLQMHPNYLEDTYIEIYKLYQGPLFKNIANKILFTPWEHDYPKDYLENPSGLFEEILELSESFEEKKDTNFFQDIQKLSPSDMYPLEN